MQVAAGLGTGISPQLPPATMNHELTPVAAASAAAVFDYRHFSEQLEGTLEIRHPLTGKVTGWKMRIAGVEHPLRKKRSFDRRREVTAEMARTGRLPTVDPQAADEAELEDLIAFTLGWQGGAVPFSPDAVREAYTDPKARWLRDQVKAGLEDRALFIDSSAPH